MRARPWRWALIGIDANVVVRWLVDDDPDQADLVERMLGLSDEPVWLNPVVLAEVAWVLRSRYKQGRGAIAGSLRLVLRHPRARTADDGAAFAALDAYEAGGAGLSDHLIGALNAATGCSTTLTFDKDAAKGPHFTLLE